MDLLTPARIWATADPFERADAPLQLRMPLPQRLTMLVMVGAPLVGLIAAVALCWHGGENWGIGWPEVGVMLVTYALTGFGVTLGFHRLLTHRSFQARRPVRLLLAVLGSAAGQGMVIRWCATHRRHHQQADREEDPHTPHHHGGEGIGGMLRGLWHAHMGWVFDVDKERLGRSVPDLVADRGLLLIDRLYFLWVALGVLLPASALAWALHSWHGFWAGLLWGGFVRICLLQHVTWSVNSVCHVWGTRPFASGDHSTNNLPVALLSLGEGWHNNHHAFPTSARHGLRWWQFDPSYLIIRAMVRLGLAWDVRLPSPTAMVARANRSCIVGN